MNNFEVAVIGGGAAGMMAAGTAAEKGLSVVLLEKNDLLGKKLSITGKGRCNITNAASVKKIIANLPRNGKFMTNAFFQFDSQAVVDFFQNRDLITKVERGGRVFPQSDNARDVVKNLHKFLRKNKVNILHQKVIATEKQADLFSLKLADKSMIKVKNLIIATGGISYPGTGSTGDGFAFARNFGHKIISLKPALVPIETNKIKPLKNVPNSRAQNITQLQGLTLKNVRIKIFDQKEKKVFEDFGEMLFTHFGVSGPIILSASSHLQKIKDHILEIDLKPALDERQLDKRLLRDLQKFSRRNFKNILKGLLPKQMIPIIIGIAGIPANKKAAEITKAERFSLHQALKKLRLNLIKFRSFNEAIITSGGVDISQIEPKTMESKLVSNLFFAGEILDVDGYTGGYNLQIAWSSGFAAGKSCR